MKNLAANTDEELLTLFSEDGSKGLELIFKKYYEQMCKTAIRITKERSLAEDIVQEVFFELFKKRETVNIKSLPGYLKRSVYNRSLNRIKSTKDIFDSNELNTEIGDNSINSQEQMEFKELSDYLNEVIDKLPEKCRLVFVLNRFEELSYKEVAAKMEISVKTVENQMSKALRILREEMLVYKKLLEKERME